MISEKIKNIKFKEKVKDKFITKSYYLAKVLAFYRKQKLCKEKENEIMEYIDIHVDDNRKNDKKYINNLIMDVLFCEIFYEIRPAEYFRYRFNLLSHEGRKQYVGGRELTKLFSAKLSAEDSTLLLDKYKTYLRFKEYYKRDVIEIVDETNRSDFIEFCKKHSTFVIKPYGRHSGQGVYKLSITEETDKQKLFDNILKAGRQTIEETIVQASEMSVFHPESINTIRFVTCNENGKIIRLQAAIRMGVGDAVVDNALAGGIVAPVDPDTGVIVGSGRSNQYAQRLFFHPDTKVQIVGCKIAYWDNLLTMAEELAKQIPTLKIVGWDFALSDKGWVLVEANSKPGLQLLAEDSVGVRSMVEKYLI